jgi:hypothetical protein
MTSDSTYFFLLQDPYRPEVFNLGASLAVKHHKKDLRMTTFALTRRMAVAGAAVAVATPALAVASKSPTPIGKLWREAEVLKSQLDTHRAVIAAKASEGGIAGWMRLGGDANSIGEARYARLMAILNTAPTNQGDVAIMARVVQDEDIQQGAKGFAADRLASAVIATASMAA